MSHYTYNEYYIDIPPESLTNLFSEDSSYTNPINLQSSSQNTNTPITHTNLNSNPLIDQTSYIPNSNL